jgi:hypothetical protein
LLFFGPLPGSELDPDFSLGGVSGVGSAFVEALLLVSDGVLVDDCEGDWKKGQEKGSDLPFTHIAYNKESRADLTL